MLRSELINQLHEENPHLTHAQCEQLVGRVLEEIIAKLAEGGRVELRRFGVFGVRAVLPRIARNPRTGAPVPRGTHAKPYFKSAPLEVIDQEKARPTRPSS